jgi:superfamily II DNA or RNA helicase
MINFEQLNQVRRIQIPLVEISRVEQSYLRLHHLAALASIETCTAAPLKTFRGRIRRIRVSLESGAFLIASLSSYEDLFDDAAFELAATDFVLEGDLLKFDGKLRWIKHPKHPAHNLVAFSEVIRNSWENGVNFVPEKVDSSGQTTRVGLRLPQIGALHALAAHRSVEGGPALVVMPTGTGKTEVMLASMIMQQPKRALVLVPSDALRTQTFEKLCSLGVLPGSAILSPQCIRPIVGLIKDAPKDSNSLDALDTCNVVVSTVAKLTSLGSALLKQFLAKFDVVYFDEAHHLPASTWQRISESLNNHRAIQFTATPFRFDGLRIPGRIIYNFPLRLAQSQGYFKKIQFLEVNETDTLQADREIATKAVEQLRRDTAAGFRHIILARADTTERADFLYANIYAPLFPDLNPTVIHTKVPGRTDRLKAIKEGRHQIIVCVDMFGEGYDLPALKIAAMHDVHGSLAITLQFIGRFTRSGRHIGDATLVTNVADVRVSEAIEDLYAEDADWNELIPSLSAKAIQSEIDFADFLQGMSPDRERGEGSFDLNILRPKTSTVIYSATAFNPRTFRKGLKKGTHIEHTWRSTDRKLLVFVTKTKPMIDWALIKETTNEIWDIFLLFHDESRRLLFIHSSQKGTLHGELAKAVSGDTARLISGERMFRAFHNVQRLIFHNVGLYGRGNLRFRMYTGLDVADAISPTQQQGSAKSNLFAVGYQNGQRISVGASQKGRVWAMSSSSIPDWREWCLSVADKILDDRIGTNAFLQHTLIPQEIDELPTGEILALSLPDTWFILGEDDSRLFAAGVEVPLVQTAITSWVQAGTRLIRFTMGWEGDSNSDFEIRWGVTGNDVAISQVSGPTLELRNGSTTSPLTNYFQESPPVIYRMDGSEIRGALYFKRPEGQFSYPRENIKVVDWGTTPIDQESKWKHGAMRPASVQGHFMSQRLNLQNAFVIDDDDSGESADIVEIVEDGTNVLVRFFHCKYSGGLDAGSRAKDLYEVCGQAVRSARWIQRPELLLRHLEKRETRLNGRPTRFEKGSLKELRALRKRLSRRRFRFEIAIVQPGLSASALSADHSSVLGAADNYVREFSGRELFVYGNA